MSCREFDQSARYEIRVKANLDEKWSGHFEGFAITAEPGEETLLAGDVRDQAALHGLLAKIRDLGIPLLLVRRVERDNTAL